MKQNINKDNVFINFVKKLDVKSHMLVDITIFSTGEFSSIYWQLHEKKGRLFWKRKVGCFEKGVHGFGNSEISIYF